MANDAWETPQALFGALDAEFRFTLDVCAMPTNSKCGRFYSPRQDGLNQPWAPERCWMNPPYSAPHAWVRKAVEEANRGALVVALLRCDPSTRWWAEFWNYEQHRPRRAGDEVRFLPHRVRFVGANGSPNFASVVVVMRPKSAGSVLLANAGSVL